MQCRNDRLSDHHIFQLNSSWKAWSRSQNVTFRAIIIPQYSVCYCLSLSWTLRAARIWVWIKRWLVIQCELNDLLFCRWIIVDLNLYDIYYMNCNHINTKKYWYRTEWSMPAQTAFSRSHPSTSFHHCRSHYLYVLWAALL